LRLPCAHGCPDSSSPSPVRAGRLIALVALTLIVVSGAGGAPDGLGARLPGLAALLRHIYPKLQTHSLIEFSNRVVSGSSASSRCRRRPRVEAPAVPPRPRLAGAALPLGVVAQAALGGLTVEKSSRPDS